MMLEADGLVEEQLSSVSSSLNLKRKSSHLFFWKYVMNIDVKLY